HTLSQLKAHLRSARPFAETTYSARLPKLCSLLEVLRTGAACGILAPRAALVGSARVVRSRGLRGGLNGAVCLCSPFRRVALPQFVPHCGDLRTHASLTFRQCEILLRANVVGGF